MQRGRKVCVPPTTRTYQLSKHLGYCNSLEQCNELIRRDRYYYHDYNRDPQHPRRYEIEQVLIPGNESDTVVKDIHSYIF